MNNSLLNIIHIRNFAEVIILKHILQIQLLKLIVSHFYKKIHN